MNGLKHQQFFLRENSLRSTLDRLIGSNRLKKIQKEINYFDQQKKKKNV